MEPAGSSMDPAGSSMDPAGSSMDPAGSPVGAAGSSMGAAGSSVGAAGSAAGPGGSVAGRLVGLPGRCATLSGSSAADSNSPAAGSGGLSPRRRRPMPRGGRATGSRGRDKLPPYVRQRDSGRSTNVGSADRFERVARARCPSFPWWGWSHSDAAQEQRHTDNRPRLEQCHPSDYAHAGCARQSAVRPMRSSDPGAWGAFARCA